VGVLLIKCPTRGSEFSTGIEVDEWTRSNLPETLTYSTCPYCGLPHYWRPGEARFVEVIPPKLWIENNSIA
jgi:hypothetical protein